MTVLIGVEAVVLIVKCIREWVRIKGEDQLEVRSVLFLART